MKSLREVFVRHALARNYGGYAIQEIERANPDTLYRIFGTAEWGNPEKFTDQLPKDPRRNDRSSTQLIMHLRRHDIEPEVEAVEQRQELSEPVRITLDRYQATRDSVTNGGLAKVDIVENRPVHRHS